MTRGFYGAVRGTDFEGEAVYPRALDELAYELFVGHQAGAYGHSATSAMAGESLFCQSLICT